ncbi:MAG: TraR/DksA family transcriptional regulator [Pseudorhodobacter sp.]
MIPVSTRREALEARLSDLLSRLDAIETELEGHEARDWEDLAVERESDEVLEGLGLSGQQEIRMIRAALERIGDGTYGLCAKCGNRISEDRLDVLPETPFCRDCA